MAQAIVDPDDLRRFASLLKKFNDEVQSGISALSGQLANMADTWRDQEHDKFVAEFEQTMMTVNRFMETSKEHIPFLLRKAERIEEYLQQR